MIAEQALFAVLLLGLILGSMVVLAELISAKIKRPRNFRIRRKPTVEIGFKACEPQEKP